MTSAGPFDGRGRKVAETSTPDGITVVLSESRLAHIVAGHENLAGHVDRVA